MTKLRGGLIQMGLKGSTDNDPETIRKAMIEAQPDTLTGLRNRALLLLGFAGALRELHLPIGGILVPLLGFNLGVEAGQFSIAFPAPGSRRRVPACLRSRRAQPAAFSG